MFWKWQVWKDSCENKLNYLNLRISEIITISIIINTIINTLLEDSDFDELVEFIGKGTGKGAETGGGWLLTWGGETGGSVGEFKGKGAETGGGGCVLTWGGETGGGFKASFIILLIVWEQFWEILSKLH